jgi:hypothetical protein
MAWGGGLGACCAAVAWPAATALKLPGAAPIALAGALIAFYAPFSVLLGAFQGRRQFGWFGGLLLAEAGLRWPVAVGLRQAGLPGATAAVAAILTIYIRRASSGRWCWRWLPWGP